MSSITKVLDKSGRGINLLPYKGLYFSPQFNQQAIEHMSDFPLREDDVLLVSYPKSGCHWAWEILRILVTGQLDNKGLDKESYMMEWSRAEEFESLPSPRVLNNHLKFDMQPRDMLTKKPKVVLFYRNFKDVAVSFYHHHVAIKEYEYEAGDFGSYLQRILDGLVETGNPFNFTKAWEEAVKKHPDLQVYWCAFEDMKDNPVAEMKNLCRFLGKDYDDSFLQQARDKTNFNHMKQTKGATNPVFYRKGQVGDWANHFTVAMNEWFDDIIKTEMAESSVKFRYTL